MAKRCSRRRIRGGEGEEVEEEEVAVLESKPTGTVEGGRRRSKKSRKAKKSRKSKRNQKKN